MTEWQSGKVPGSACACSGADAQGAKAALREAAVVETFVDESHYSVRVVACAQCGKRWVKVFTEKIDWEGGDDSQAWMWIPVEPREEAALRAAKGSERAVLALWPRRHLCDVWPRGQERRVFWQEGAIVVLPHD